MENRVRPTRAGLFAIELFTAVCVFVFCAAVCGGLFVRADVMSRESEDLSRAVNEARSAAECYKAAGGDLYMTAELFGGEVEGGVLVWESEDGLVIHMTSREEDGYTAGGLTASLDGETLVDWDIAALEETT